MPLPSLAKKMKEFDAVRETPEYAVHLDEWTNPNTGIGTGHDKVVGTQFQVLTGPLMPSQLEDLYHNDDIAARICDLIPRTALREPFKLNNPGLQKKMEDLGVYDKFQSAWSWGRLYGGGPIILGGEGPSNTPLTTGVNSLFLADRWTIGVVEFYTDTSSPKYGEPKMYRVMRPSLQGLGSAAPAVSPDPNEMIHESRVIVFPGAHTSPRRKLFNGYWDDSVLQRVYQVVQAYGLTWASVVHLLQDAAQGVYAMQDLWNMIVGGNKDKVEERMKLVDEQRSSARMMLIDADHESFTRVPTPFAGIPELIDRISERLASASEYPLTVLMGSSPAGMNATGKSDLEIYYGRCEVERRQKLTPAVKKLAAAMGEDLAALTVTYPPLWMPTAQEVAETRYANAQSDNIYFQMGADPAAIVEGRFTPNGYSSELVLTEKDVGDAPAVAAAKQQAKAAGTPSGEGASTAVGTHHFSPKYGR
jgi:uncharacterized protein